MEDTKQLMKLGQDEKRSVRQALKSLKHTGAGSQSKFLKKMFGEDLSIVKELYDAAGSFPKFFQMEELVKGYAILEKMRGEYAETGKLPQQYHQLQKNVIALTDKIRKQDEGIKVSGEIVHSIDRVREIIDIQEAKVQDAEVIEQKKAVVRSSSIGKDSKLEE